MTYDIQLEYSTEAHYNVLHYTCEAPNRGAALRQALAHVAWVWGIRETHHGERLEASMLRVGAIAPAAPGQEDQ